MYINLNTTITNIRTWLLRMPDIFVETCLNALEPLTGVTIHWSKTKLFGIVTFKLSPKSQNWFLYT